MPKVALDPVTICNMALRHLGQTKGLEDFDNDQTEAGDGCRIFYPVVLDEVLNGFAWPFATKFDSLVLVSDPTIAVNPEWFYSYRYPIDAIWIRRLLPASEAILPNFAGFPTSTGPGVVPSFQPIETQTSRVKYRISRDDSGLLILTNFPPIDETDTTPAYPLAEYIFQEDNSGAYPIQFGQAMAAKLAYYLAPSLTQGDKFKLGFRAGGEDGNGGLYRAALDAARANAINEEAMPALPDAEWIQAR